jgi:hypothetical protein
MPRQLPSDILAKMRSRIEALTPEELHDFMDSLESPAIDRGSDRYRESLDVLRRRARAAREIAASLPWLEFLEFSIATTDRKYDVINGLLETSDDFELIRSQPTPARVFLKRWKTRDGLRVVLQTTEFLDRPRRFLLSFEVAGSADRDQLLYVSTAETRPAFSTLLIIHSGTALQRDSADDLPARGLGTSVLIAQAYARSMAKDELLIARVDLRESIPLDPNVVGAAIAAAHDEADRAAWETWLESRILADQVSGPSASDIRRIAASIRGQSSPDKRRAKRSGDQPDDADDKRSKN